MVPPPVAAAAVGVGATPGIRLRPAATTPRARPEPSVRRRRCVVVVTGVPLRAMGGSEAETGEGPGGVVGPPDLVQPGPGLGTPRALEGGAAVECTDEVGLHGPGRPRRQGVEE